MLPAAASRRDEPNTHTVCAGSSTHSAAHTLLTTLFVLTRSEEVSLHEFHRLLMDRTLAAKRPGLNCA